MSVFVEAPRSPRSAMFRPVEFDPRTTPTSRIYGTFTRKLANLDWRLCCKSNAPSPKRDLRRAIMLQTLATIKFTAPQCEQPKSLELDDNPNFHPAPQNTNTAKTRNVCR